jgi:hypothetical protein
MFIPGIKVMYDYSEDNLLFVRFLEAALTKESHVLYHDESRQSLNRPWLGLFTSVYIA